MCADYRQTWRSAFPREAWERGHGGVNGYTTALKRPNSPLVPMLCVGTFVRRLSSDLA
ncbi:hypothetical protein QUF90_04975 [Desulfococcaceae bacterium HSG9]|nr:hypothetical protein [Desulfococcaceae bacterium HSG9]